MRNMIATKLPAPLPVLSSVKAEIFFLLYKGKKSPQGFLIKNETEIHQIFQ